MAKPEKNGRLRLEIRADREDVLRGAKIKAAGLNAQLSDVIISALEAFCGPEIVQARQIMKSEKKG